MKTFAEIQRAERTPEQASARRAAKNAEHLCTRAQIEVQYACAQQLVHWCAYLEACSQLIASGELHPMQHPLYAYYEQRRREQLLAAQHPASALHPLAQ